MPRRPDQLRARARCDRDARPSGALHHPLTRAIVRGLMFAVLAGASARTWAADTPVQATSSRAAREDAIRSIPLAKLDADDQKRVSATISATSIYRRLPTQVTECDPDMYLFLVRHPEVVVNIWEVMQVSNVALERTGADTFRAADGAGTLCQVKFCYSDHETQVIYAEGSYDGPLFKRPVRAKVVLLLKSGYIRETNGKYYVTSRMDTFIHIDHAGVEMLAKTLQLLVHRAADYNFTETAAFLGTISRTSEANPSGIGRLANKLTKLEPQVRDRFAELAMEVGRKARQRELLGANGDPLPVHETAEAPMELGRR